MPWEIEYTDQFGEWWDVLTEAEQKDVAHSLSILEECGPTLGFPHSSGIAASRHSHMRELRVQHAGRPYRVLYAFDPRRTAILLLGGDKTGNDHWYAENVPRADKLYDGYIAELRKEGVINDD